MPIFTSGMASTYLTAGCWSPTRPGVIYTARDDGSIEVRTHIYTRTAHHLRVV